MDKFIKIANRGKYFLIFVSGLVLCLMTLLYTNDIPWHSPPTDTSTPTSTFPPTFDSTIAQPSFCYSGPNESNLGAIPLSAGMDVEILAISDSEDWFMIRGVDIDPCWVEANVLYISSSFDPRRVQVFTTIITTENTACRIFPDSGRTVQTIIPIDRRIVSYGKSDPEAKWILVVPHDSTKFCWIENKSELLYPELQIESPDFALTPTPTPTRPTVVVVIPTTKKPTKEPNNPPPTNSGPVNTPNPLASNTPAPPTNTPPSTDTPVPPTPIPTDTPIPPTPTLCWPPGKCK